MKKVILITLVLLQIFPLLKAQDNEEIDSSKTPLINIPIVKSENLNIDLKYIDPEKGQFGIDYDLVLSTKKENNHSSSFNFKSRGFITVSNTNSNSLNTIKNILNYTIEPRFSESQKATTTRTRDVGTSIVDGQDVSAKETRPLYVWFDLHANHETSQDFKDYNYAAGASMVVDAPIIGRIIDIPFQLLRTNNFQGFNKLEVNAAFDYVWGLENTQLLSDTTSISSINRATIGGFFETEVFSNIRFVCNVESYFLLDAPESIKRISKDENYFLQLRLDIPIDKNKDKSNKYISIKYIEGTSPPNFNKGYVLGAGLFMTF